MDNEMSKLNNSDLKNDDAVTEPEPVENRIKYTIKHKIYDNNRL